MIKRYIMKIYMGSIAHVKMLAKCNILTHEECETIVNGLNSILSDIEEGKLNN